MPAIFALGPPRAGPLAILPIRQLSLKHSIIALQGFSQSAMNSSLVALHESIILDHSDHVHPPPT